MSYGTNNPWGLQAVRTQTDATWNGKTNTYYINPAYANNIFKGDLVYLSTNGANAGFISNLGDLDATGAGGPGTISNTTVIGVFDGCEYQVNNQSANTDPANPGRSCWLGANGLANATGVTGNPYPIAYVITDPQVVFNAQVAVGNQAAGSNGACASAVTQIGSFINVCYNYTDGSTQPGAGKIIAGNTSTGQSSMFLDFSTLGNAFTVGNAAKNCFIDAFSRQPGNIMGMDYTNFEVVLANHVLRQFGTIAAVA